MHDYDMFDRVPRVIKNPPHDCATDHIASWPSLRKEFAFWAWDRSTRKAVVALQFAECPMSPGGRTLVLRFETVWNARAG